MFADLRLGPHLMGSEVDWSGPRPLRVHARGYTELARVDIVRDGEVVHAVRGEPELPPGEPRVDLRVEWGKARRPPAGTAGWRCDGGRLLLPELVGPEVVAMDAARACAWEHTTHSFGEPYGAQRGGVEVSVCGPADALVHLDAPAGTIRIPLAELADRLARRPFVPDPGRLPGELALQPAVGALLGLGVRELDVAFDDDVRAAPGVLLRPGVPGGRRAGLVVADLGVLSAATPGTVRTARGWCVAACSCSPRRRPPGRRPKQAVRWATRSRWTLQAAPRRRDTPSIVPPGGRPRCPR